ncbi:MAG: PilZ domain-containing protein [Deltaproteobacteria bacterium]|nr:PilZ domain-containing protein [Deltaproteobacteria bacterium]
MTQEPYVSDQRRYPRIPKEIKVEVQHLTYPLPKNSAATAKSKDISRAGICFSSESPFEPKSVLSLKINLQGLEGYKRPHSRLVDLSEAQPLSVIGEVAWCKKSSDGASFDVGIQFVNVYEDDERALARYLKDT